MAGLEYRSASGAPATDGRGRLLTAGVAALWQHAAPRYAESRRRILFSRDVATGKVRAPVPKKLARNRAIFSPTLPQLSTIALHNASVMGRKEPRLVRGVANVSPAADARATRIEQWANATLLRLLSWGELVGRVQDDGEAALIVAPAEADPARPVPSWLDERTGEPRRSWWRAKDGSSPADYAGREREFRRDRKATAAAFEEALERHDLESPQLAVRLVAATDCVPLGLRLTGDGPEIDGLLVRTRWQRNDLLRRGFRWGEGAHLERSTHSGLEEVDLIEAWLTDADGRPYLSYAAQGLATTFAETGEDAVIDLHERYGMGRLLCFYDYGAHWAIDDPDLRGVPFVYPYASGLLSAQAVIGSSLANLWQRGFGSRGIVPNRDAPPEAYLEGNEPRTIRWEPGGDMPVLPGEVVDLVPQAVSSDAWRIVDVLLGSVAEQGPPAGAFGGEGPDSGRERTLMRRHLEDAQAQILEGGLRLWRKAGGALLELECGLRERGRRPTPARADGLFVDADGAPSRRRTQVVRLDPDEVAGDYGLEAKFLPRLGENLAVAQQAFGFAEKRAIPWRYFWEEILGVESPSSFEAEIVAEDMARDEEGRAEIRAIAARLRADDREARLAKLRAEGRVTPSGAPAALAGGLAPPPVDPRLAAMQALAAGMAPAGGAPMGPPGAPMGPPGGGGAPVGLGLPDPGAAALGGAVSAGMETGPIMADARLVGGGAAGA